MSIVFFVVGLLFLIAGAEILVKGASRLASAMGISPLVVGLVIVAWGTSSPELIVSINAALSGQAGIAVGNVVGSNIFNVLFILGLSAIVIPLIVTKNLIRIDVPVMIGVSVAAFVLCWDRLFSWVDGLIFLVGLIVYTTFLIRQSRKEFREDEDQQIDESEMAVSGAWEWSKNIGLVLGGLLLLVFGAQWLVDSAVAFARYMGVSELITGLTIIAAGTSLPEVVTSLVAAFRGNQDIAVGNVVGSNIFNLMGVLGAAGIVAPAGIGISDAIISFDLPVMMAVAFACLPIFVTGGRVSRGEGMVLFLYYIAYTLYLILAVTQHDALTGFNMIMLYFVLPLTIMTLVVIAMREKGKQQE